VQDRILAAQDGVHPQYRVHDTFKHHLAGGELADAVLEPQARISWATSIFTYPGRLDRDQGIGPSVQEKLRSLGIMTFEDLARADPDRLVDQLKTSLPVSKARVRGWTEVARERTEARD
jgi:predicted flap endonuclease-1-like 5' DNA nuclease